MSQSSANRRLGAEPEPSAAAPAPRSFLADLTVEHGPVALLGRFFLAADAECRRRGVTLSFGTFDEIVAANRANPDSWKPLFPAYDPAFHDFNADNSFVFIGRDATGRVVVTQAGILFRLETTTFHEFAEALRVNYDEPARMMRPNERCIPTAPSLRTMRGRVLFGGATWFHPSLRGTGLAEITPRISRAYGYTRFKTDYTTSFMVEGPLKGGLAKRAAFPHVEWGVRFENSPMGDFQCALCWMGPDYLLADLETWLGGLASQIDAEVRERRA
jgi:hypothetical protein